MTMLRVARVGLSTCPRAVSAVRAGDSVTYFALRNGTTSIRPPVATVLALREQRCLASTTPRQNPEQPKDRSKQQEPRASISHILWMQFRGSFVTLSKIFRGRNWRALFRQSPEEFVAAVFILITVAGGIGSVVYLYFTYFYSEQFTRFPPAVAKSLRRAIYYSDHSPDPQLALKYYQMAIKQSLELGLDPFSDEVMGIKIRLAQWLEKISHFVTAIDVLEQTLADNKRWLDTAQKNPRRLPRARDAAVVQLETIDAKSEAQTRPETQAEFDTWLRVSRSRILAKSVAISTKLGELYADEHVMQTEKAHERLVWAVETSLAELRRRTSQPQLADEAPWMSAEEIGGALESLAHSYESRGQFDLALPLFFQALRLCREQCHTAVLMNNLATAFAQHPLRAPFESPDVAIPNQGGRAVAPPKVVPTRQELLESAQRWAQNAYSHANEPIGEVRTLECDQACAVAMINLGDIAAMMGRTDEAKRMYDNGVQLSKRFDFVEGVSQAQSGLQRLPR